MLSNPGAGPVRKLSSSCGAPQPEFLINVLGMRLMSATISSRLSSRPRGHAPMLACLLFLSTASAQDRTEAARRYPYDPVCSWGRIADGHGVLVRCLTEGEATQLTEPSAAQHANSTSPTLTLVSRE